MPNLPIPTIALPGWVHRDDPRSAREALSRQAFGAARKITKAALVRFIRNHFDGPYKDMFRAVIPTADGYVTDLNSTERMQVPILLARKYPDLLSRTPAIVINGKKGKILPTSIAGGLEGGIYSAALDQRMLQLTIRWLLDMEVFVASTDPNRADDIQDAVVTIFTVLRTITQSAMIRSEDDADKWVVLLPPQDQIDVEGPTETPLQDSKKDSIWSYAISLPCTFEGNSIVREVHRTDGQPELSIPLPSISTTLPATIPLGATFRAFVQNRPVGSVFRSDNMAIASVDFDGMIKTFRLGSFNFQVVKPLEGGLAPEVLFTRAVQVVP